MRTFVPIVMALALTFHAHASPLHKEASPERFRAGDQAFRERRDAKRARESLSIYRKYWAEHPKDFEAAWRVSMACHFVGMRVSTTKEEKEELFTEGKEAGRAAIELSPNCAACHFWTAINIALYGEQAGVFKMIFMLKTVQEHLKKTVESDPAYAYSGAYRLLGVIQRKLPGVLGGSNSDAKNYFEKAVELSPDEPMNYIELARILDEQFHDRKGALAVAKKGLSQPVPDEDRVESRDALEELKRYLKALESSPVVADQ